VRFIGGQNQNIARGIQDGGADFAVFQMLFDFEAQLGVDGAIDIFRNVTPDVARS